MHIFFSQIQIQNTNTKFTNISHATTLTIKDPYDGINENEEDKLKNAINIKQTPIKDAKKIDTTPTECHK